jgi:hypothetical protein
MQRYGRLEWIGIAGVARCTGMLIDADGRLALVGDMGAYMPSTERGKREPI